jgi:hypothetical protein
MMKKFTLSTLLFLITTVGLAQIQTLDAFESKEGWEFILSDGVKLDLNVVEGRTGNALRFDYDFTKGTGYGGFQKMLPIDLPENYEFSFYLKAESPANNFEVKFIDSSGDNVWWVNNRNYDFPEEWKKITIKKRHIGFAWGPTIDRDLKRIDRIEFTIASFVGGKGTIWIDDLKFEPLPAETSSYPEPIVTASSAQRRHQATLILDSSKESSWLSRKRKNQFVHFDFRTRREFGGLQINWEKNLHARSFDILISDDNKTWEKVYSVGSNHADVSFIRMPETEARFLKINMLDGAAKNRFGIAEIVFLNIQNAVSANDFMRFTAQNSTPGDYPRYFLEQASYWTVTGVNNDLKEALINEDGMVEVDKALFSVEPMIKSGDKLYNWNNVQANQSMNYFEDESGLGFTPSVSWLFDEIKFVTAISASGEANVDSRLNIAYSFTNNSGQAKNFEFYLLVRPFQVNPYYQFLNLEGGVGRIDSIHGPDKGRTIAIDEKKLFSTIDYDQFSAFSFDDGNMVDFIRKGENPGGSSSSDPQGLAGGLMKYLITLEPGERKEFFVVVPFYDPVPENHEISNENIANDFKQSAEFWENRVDHIKFNLPESADRIVNTYKSNLVYILINRDMAGIQPGSRSYERSWIRDGSLTSSALLKSGIVEEVGDFIEWYARHQFESGKVPCVVDSRGPDPVPEHDSHGQLIYLIREYFNFTGDTAFLRSKNENVLKAVEYIESLIAERSTDHFKYGNDSIRAYYGLVPESISHEGYSEKPMHSYWDNFFIMKGLKDAVEIQRILGEQEHYENIVKTRDTFRENLYNSFQLAMKTRNIDYLPGSVELGDFDATSTTIALTPCNELNNLPRPEVYNTFERYYKFFRNRRDGIKMEELHTLRKSADRLVHHFGSTGKGACTH